MKAWLAEDQHMHKMLMVRMHPEYVWFVVEGKQIPVMLLLYERSDRLIVSSIFRQSKKQELNPHISFNRIGAKCNVCAHATFNDPGTLKPFNRFIPRDVRERIRNCIAGAGITVSVNAAYELYDCTAHECSVEDFIDAANSAGSFTLRATYLQLQKLRVIWSQVLRSEDAIIAPAAQPVLSVVSRT